MASHLPGAVDVESTVVPASELSSVGDAAYSGLMASNAATKNGEKVDVNKGGMRHNLVNFQDNCGEEEERQMDLVEASISASNLVSSRLSPLLRRSIQP